MSTATQDLARTTTLENARPLIEPDRRTKIVCTLGPSTDTDGTLDQLITSGMNVARLNFSHGDHSEHAARYSMVRAAAERHGATVAVLADLQGPKIRLGRFEEGPTVWSVDEIVRITVEDVPGTHRRVSTTYGELAADARPGDTILVDDGKLELRVESIEGASDVVCRVIHGGPISNNKGLSLPGMNVSVPALSDKDARDLEFALDLGVDLVALSFVRQASDIDRVHAVMDRVGRRTPVIAKIEKPEAVADIEAIVNAFDAEMVARGDLGVEIPLENVPLAQKRVIELAREYAKPVIVATQMLDSMIENSRPTRAEASDVANAVLDGADAVMLSGETSVGRHAAEAVRTMSRIVVAAEAGSSRASAFRHLPKTRSGVVSYAARDIAERLEARALVAYTQSGDTVRRVARLHPSLPIVGFTPNVAVRNSLALSWGTDPHLVDRVETTDAMIAQIDQELTENGLCVHGDTVVIIAGVPAGTEGLTNSIRVHRIGGPLTKYIRQSRSLQRRV